MKKKTRSKINRRVNEKSQLYVVITQSRQYNQFYLHKGSTSPQKIIPKFKSHNAFNNGNRNIFAMLS